MTVRIQKDRDERTVRSFYRVGGYLGPWSSSLTLAWLAAHRERLHSLILSGKRLSLLVIWDTKGTQDACRSDADVEAIRTLVNGGDPIECDRCEGTGDRFGRAYGPKLPCPGCGGDGTV